MNIFFLSCEYSGTPLILSWIDHINLIEVMDDWIDEFFYSQKMTKWAFFNQNKVAMRWPYQCA